MNNIKIFISICILALILCVGFWYTSQEAKAPTKDTVNSETPLPSQPTSEVPTNKPVSQPQTYKDVIRLQTPLQNEPVKSPLTVTGEARGTWYFEASFPVILTNWDGLIIAEGVAQAQSDWMTEEYVPFEVTLTYEPPFKTGDPDFMQRGSLILKKDNPSGLPENDDAYEVTVMFDRAN